MAVVEGPTAIPPLSEKKSGTISTGRSAVLGCYFPTGTIFGGSVFTLRPVTSVV